MINMVEINIIPWLNILFSTKMITFNQFWPKNPIKLPKIATIYSECSNFVENSY